VLTKSRGAIAASVLALAAAGGGSAVVIRAMSQSAGPVLVSPAAQPSMAGQPATAAVPRGAGGADAAGSVTAGGGAGQQGPGAGTAAPGPGSPGIPALSRSAGQGDPGPLPQGALPADGAVPGASPAVQALASARAAMTALPHSPRLLAQLASAPGTPAAGGGAGSAQAAPSPGTSAAGTSSPSPSAPAPPVTPTATASPPPGPSPAAPASSGPPPVTSPPAGGLEPAVAGAVGGQAAASAAPRTLAGLDVAGFQHPGGAAISWSAVAKAGYKFAAVKATEGDYYVNPWAASDLKGAKAAGLVVTPYHFAVPNASGGAAQAQFAVEYSGYAAGARTLPLMLDIEYDPYNSTDHANECYGLNAAKMTAWLSAFVTAARSLTGQYPVIYTTADWWDTCTGRSSAFSADPMWVAAYGTASPPKPAGWRVWTFWQYSSGGTVPGVASARTTDLDIFSPSAIGLIDPGGQSAKTGARVSLPVASLGASAGEALTYSAAGLPPGLAVAKGGTVTGTVAKAAAPKAATTYKVTVSVKNAAGMTATAAFSWRVSPA
jgi:GH25 family lysozyme M1 (1,4-beta-N-acetylmuramidase)